MFLIDAVEDFFFTKRVSPEEGGQYKTMYCSLTKLNLQGTGTISVKSPEVTLGIQTVPCLE